MLELIFTHQAQSDLDEIWDYLASEADEAIADRVVDEIRYACERIVEFPHSGRTKEMLRPDLRSFIVRNYVFFYYVHSDGIEIIRILHGARDIESLIDSTNS